jgi:hypothetical protein
MFQSVINFFTVATPDESELPPLEFRRTDSDSDSDFNGTVGTPGKKAASPAKAKSTAKRSASKREREPSVLTGAAQATETKLQTPKLAKAISNADLSDYLEQVGADQPSKATKANLLKAAIAQMQQKLAALESPAAPATAPVAAAAPVEAAPVNRELSMEDEKPTKSWTIAKLKAYAGDNKIDIAGLKGKSDIFDAVAPAPAKRSTSKAAAKRSSSVKK